MRIPGLVHVHVTVAIFNVSRSTVTTIGL